MWTDGIDAERHRAGSLRHCGAGTSHLFSVRHDFPTHRAHERDKWWFYTAKFWDGCSTTAITGTDADSESVIVIREERTNQKAAGCCSYNYPTTCWHSRMEDSAKLKIPDS